MSSSRFSGPVRDLSGQINSGKICFKIFPKRCWPSRDLSKQIPMCLDKSRILFLFGICQVGVGRIAVCLNSSRFV